MARIKQIKKAQTDDEIEIGDQVKHPKFGTGTVLYKTGTGERAKAIVVFQEEGQKKLLLKYAKLKKIKETKPAEEVGAPASEEEETGLGAVSDTEEIEESDEEEMEEEMEEDAEEGDAPERAPYENE